MRATDAGGMYAERIITIGVNKGTAKAATKTLRIYNQGDGTLTLGEGG